MQEDIVKLDLTKEELSKRKLESRTIEAALEALHRDGVVVLSNAVDTRILDHFNGVMVKEAQQYAKTLTRNEEFNFGRASV